MISGEVVLLFSLVLAFIIGVRGVSSKILRRKTSDQESILWEK